MPPPPRALAALVLLAWVAALAQAFFFIPAPSSPLKTPVHQQHRRRRLPPTAPLGSSSSSAASSGSMSAEDVEAKLQGVWDKDVPPSIEAVIAQAQASLGAALEAGERRLRVDIRTPGLDEALEQTAIREKSLLLSVVGAFFPLLATAKKAKVLFESEVRERWLFLCGGAGGLVVGGVR
jgi:hypothetical protein